MTIEIAYATDDRYAPLTCASIASILYHTQSFCRFHILESRLTVEHKERLLGLRDRFDHFECIFHHVDPSSYAQLDYGNFTIETYYRALLPDLLSDVDKLLYLDGDTIARGDIAEIYQMDVTDSLAAAAPDLYCNARAKHREVLGLKAGSVCFNAGIMLFNLKRLRQEEVFHDFARFTLDLRARFRAFDEPWYADQETLNVLFDGRILALPLRMNAQAQQYWIEQEYTQSLFEHIEAIQNPLIIHYNGRTKPNFLGDTAYAYCRHIDLYFVYKEMTPYHDNPRDQEMLRDYRVMEEHLSKSLIAHVSRYIRREIIPICQRFANRLSECLNGRELVLWGATRYTPILMVEMGAMGLYADHVVDEHADKQGTSLFHYPVEAPDFLKGSSDRYCVVLTTQHRETEAERMLMDYGYGTREWLYALDELINRISEAQ